MTIVVPTPMSDEEYFKTTAGQCLKALDDKIDWVVLGENKLGISELYDRYLNDKEGLDYLDEDIVVFMHDDVEVHDRFLFEKLNKAHEQFDIVGLAGSASQDYTKGKPTAWHLSTDREHTRGFVSHAIPGKYSQNGRPYVNSSFFGPTPSPVVVMDGLFISVNKKKFREANVQIKKDYTFHHYDMSLCAEAGKKGLKLGVYPIFVIHHGLGEFANDPVWIESNKQFLQDYGSYTRFCQL